MNKIINGKLFDTDTAELLKEKRAEPNTKDLNYINEMLYKTAKGIYFLLVENTYIEVIEEDKAKAWAEQNMTGKEYINIFGAVEEG